MKPLNNFSFLAILIMLSSCSPSLYYRPAVVQPDAADVIYTNGIPALRTSIQGCEVVAELTSKGERDMNLNLFIRNNSDSAFTFFPAAVEARGYNGAGQWSPYRVFEAEEYIRWKNNRDALISAGVMVATVATVVAIDRAINNGSPGNNVENLNSVAVGVDMVYNLTWWMAATIPAMTAEPPSPPAYSPDFLLRDHTLYPGEAVQGIVKLRAAQEFKNKILVEVPVNGAYAQFVFDRASAVR